MHTTFKIKLAKWFSMRGISRDLCNADGLFGGVLSYILGSCTLSILSLGTNNFKSDGDWEALCTASHRKCSPQQGLLPD